MRAARPYERRCAHPASTRRHDSTWIPYVTNTTSAERASHPGRRASTTCNERNSLQFLTIASHTIRATTPATASCRPHQSHLRTGATTALRRHLGVQGLEALRDDGRLEALPQGCAGRRREAPGFGVEAELLDSPGHLARIG